MAAVMAARAQVRWLPTAIAALHPSPPPARCRTQPLVLAALRLSREILLEILDDLSAFRSDGDLQSV